MGLGAFLIEVFGVGMCFRLETLVISDAAWEISVLGAVCKPPHLRIFLLRPPTFLTEAVSIMFSIEVYDGDGIFWQYLSEKVRQLCSDGL
jgi:hypothetical protein